MPDDSLSILRSTRYCVQAFWRCLQQSKDRKTATTLENELGRLKIWAGNIGVFADGNASADYRLRNEPDIKLAIIQMLMRVVKELEISMQPSKAESSKGLISPASHDNAGNESPLSSRSSSPSLVVSSESDTDSVLMPEDKSAQPPFVSSHIKSVENIIGRLYRLASVIRRPITYSENARIADFVRKSVAAREISAEIESHVRFQIEHIQFRRSEPETKSSIPPVPPFLVRRLVQAAVLRRQRLLYRERHQKKLDHGSKLANPTYLTPQNTLEGESTPDKATGGEMPLIGEDDALQKPAKPPNTLRSSSRTLPLSATEASMINSAHENLKPRSGALSAVTRSAVMRREQLDIPPPPRVNAGTKDIICPYCFVILEASVIKPAHWTRHVLKDLDPYVCMFEDCEQEHHLFNSSDDWFHHMQWQHTLEWSCQAPDHEDHIFHSQSDFEVHLLSYHTGSFTKSQLPLLILKSAKPSADTFHICPLCHDDLASSRQITGLDNATGTTKLTAAPSFRHHIAQHLEALAVLSLPERADLDEHVSNERPSQSADPSNLVEKQMSLRADFRDDPGVVLMSSISMSDEDIPDVETDWTHIQQDLQTRQDPHPTPSQDGKLEPFVIRAQQQRLDTYCKQIERWLLAPDPSPNYAAGLQIRTQRATHWIFGNKHFKSWDQNTGPSLLWIYGSPGSGKKSLSSTVIEHELKRCAADPNLAVAYFFFTYSDNTKQTVLDMLRSLLTQLLKRCKRLVPAMEVMVKAAESGFEHPSVEKLLEYFEALVATFKHTFVILNRLHESTEQGHVTRVIEQLVTIKKARIHLLATSHMTPFFEEVFDSIKPKVDTAERLNSNQEHTGDDVRAYIHGELENHERFRGLPIDFRKEIEDTLVEKSVEMFQYAACQLEVLRGCLTVARMRKALQMMPSTLEETYIRVLCNIPNAYHKGAYTLLQWLANSFSTLTVGELAEVLAVDNALQVQDLDSRVAYSQFIIQLCPGLVKCQAIDVNTEPETIAAMEVSLVHDSVKRFLFSKNIKERSARGYSIDEAESHAHISEICLAYLEYLDRELVVDYDVKRFPLILYAAKYWPSHAFYSNQNPRVIERTLQFFKARGNQLRNWASLYDKDYEDLGLASPVYYASEAGLAATLRVLLEAGERLEEESSARIPLLVASANGHEDVVRMLLSKGANVHAWESDTHQTALDAAVQNGHAAIVKILLDWGAVINEQDKSHEPALHKAVRNGYTSIVKLLLDHGANANTRNVYGWTPLHEAANEGHETIVKILLDCGANIDAEGYDCWTALQGAAINGRKTTVRLLLDRGANVNPKGLKDKTALQEAASKGHVSIVKMLLDSGANPNPCRVSGYNHYCGAALEVAVGRGHEDVVRLLLDAGADPNWQCAEARELAADRQQGGYFGNISLEAARKSGHERSNRFC